MAKIKAYKEVPLPEDLKRVMLREIGKETDRVKYELMAIALYTLWSEFGFGRARLARFWNKFDEEYTRIKEFYQFDKTDTVWVIAKKLRDNVGIDVERWDKFGTNE